MRKLGLLRRRPELLVGPAWVGWILVNGLPITFGQPFLPSLLRTAMFEGHAGPAFPLTYGMAVALFGFALFVLRPLGALRAVLVASAFPFAFTHLYEIPYDLLGRVVWPQYYGWAIWPIVLLLNSSWLLLGLSTSIYWRMTRRSGSAVAAAVALFAVWWITFWPPLGSIAPRPTPRGAATSSRSWCSASPSPSCCGRAGGTSRGLRARRMRRGSSRRGPGRPPERGAREGRVLA